MGYDLFTPINFKIQPKEQKTVFIDLAITPPEGYYAQLMSKSGLTVLYELEVKDGVIDPDFTGNIGVVLKNNSDQPIEHLAGEQIAQLLFIKVATPRSYKQPAWPGQSGASMASGCIQTNKRIRKQFQRGLQMLLDTFYDTILIYTQDIQVVNFSDISRGICKCNYYVQGCSGKVSEARSSGKNRQRLCPNFRFSLAGHEKSSPRGTK